MIIANVIGGLGNQMFQYSAALALSLQSGRDLVLATDCFARYKLHNGFELERVFGVKTPVASREVLAHALGPWAVPQARAVLSRPGMRWIRPRNWRCEPYIWYWPDMVKKSDDSHIYLHGYWQSEKYFSRYAESVRESFQIKLPFERRDAEIIDRMRKGRSVSLHIRRGDYQKAKNRKLYAECGLEYYKSAIRYVTAQVEGARFFVFSDEPEWARQNLSIDGAQVEFVSHNNGTRGACDLRLMSCANHHIIANSTFSWWGAWLNPSGKKLVVAPARWFRDQEKNKDLVPCEWIKI